MKMGAQLEMPTNNARVTDVSPAIVFNEQDCSCRIDLKHGFIKAYNSIAIIAGHFITKL